MYSFCFKSGVLIMTEKLTNEQFAESPCNGYIWLRKVDAGHCFCQFQNCFKELEIRYSEQIKKEMMRDG